MAEANFRSPAPISVGGIDGDLLGKLEQIIPENSVRAHDVPASMLTGDLSRLPPDNIFRAAQPIVSTAVDHYASTFGTQPDEIRFRTKSFANTSAAVDKWHRDALFPGELLYIVTQKQPTEFAIGKGTPVLEYAPEFMINSLTKGLLRAGRLDVAQAQEGELTAFGADTIHRRPELTGDVRISVTMHLLSRSLSRAMYDESFRERMKFKMHAEKR